MRLLQNAAVKNAVQLAAGLGPVARSGIIAPVRPDRLVRVAVDWVRWDFTPGSLLAISAHRHPDRVAVVDDAGEITYAELVATVEALARSLQARGVGAADKVGVLCRNHRAVLQVLGATGRLGGDLVLLNTGLSQGQLADVISEQDLDVIVADAEFAEAIPTELGDTLVLQAWADVEDAEQARDDTDHEIARSVPTLAELITDAPPESEQKLPRRPRRGRTVVLTSGTTGTPKGARRPEPSSWMPAASVLSRIPLRAGGVTLVPAPLFHTWGFAGMQLSLALSSTMVLRRRFDPQALLADLERHRADTVIAVPVMLQRVAELDEADRDVDSSSLRVVATSGSPIRPALVERILASFGPVLYNLYGSTEVSWVSVATPDEIREHPTTAGRPPMGTELAILDDDGNPTPDGEVGRVFVGNGMLFEGYTREGEDKEVVGGDDEHRRPRQARPRRAAVLVRAQRRHDCLRRGERVPQRGRGPAQQARRGEGGGRDRRRRRRLGHPPGGLRGADRRQRGVRTRRGHDQGPRQVRAGHVLRSPRRPLPHRAAPQTRPARSCRASWPTRSVSRDSGA